MNLKAILLRVYGLTDFNEICQGETLILEEGYRVIFILDRRSCGQQPIII